MSSTSIKGNALAQESFDLWAEVYDEQPNPLLALEERHLLNCLPPLPMRNVLDAGCGTGRWLAKFAELSPASLVGIDCSNEMLSRARAKLGERAQLYEGDCTALPVADASVDLLLSSFVLSYVQDLKAFARECGRVARAGATIVISDMHPETAIKRKWKRVFHRHHQPIEIEAHSRSIDYISEAFLEQGFQTQALLESCFEAPERPFFEASGKLSEFEKLSDDPAIYVLTLRKLPSAASTPGPGFQQTLQLSGARIAVDSDRATIGTIAIRRGYIESISVGMDRDSNAFPNLDLSGYLILPGLINAHDHLDFSLFPRLGRSANVAKYRNSKEWGHEIHQTHADVIALHRQVPRETRLWWGAIRNLICGVTTVCHHDRPSTEFDDPDFPVHVLSNFSWSHSLSFDPDLPEAFRNAPAGLPFIFHAAEGVDHECAREVFRLDEMQVLRHNSVLVHGLGLIAESAALLNQRGASLIICPTSNEYLFGCSPSKSLLSSIERLALGSDSPITAAGDLLSEIHFAYSIIGLDPRDIYDMVTSNAAAILQLQEGEGWIRKPGRADLIAVRDQHMPPAETLARLSLDQVELVSLAGTPQLASPRLYERLPQTLREGMQLLEVDGHRRWIRAPLPDLFDSAEAILGRNNLVIGGRKVRHFAAI
jgi:cytosine/adenosine deaminase-related metal-dependent hydrolase/ubiquinone/menaquinone biosynthesis C-methylase UbiE